MNSNDLQQAIVFLKAGKKAEAQRLLQIVIRSNPHNETAWLWYVDTLSTDAERTQALTWCLKFNPNSDAARKGLALFGARAKSLTRPITDELYTPKSVSQSGKAAKVAEPEYSYGRNRTRIESGADEGVSDFQRHEFYCEDCGETLTICSVCGAYLCEDCQNARCNVCGEPIYIESEEELERDGFRILRAVPVYSYEGDDIVAYEEVYEDEVYESEEEDEDDEAEYEEECED